MKRWIRPVLILLAALVGLAGVAAALVVRQVPAGHRLQVEGVIHDEGLILAPIWVERTLLPPADPPTIEVPAAEPAPDPRATLEARLETARAALSEAEQHAVEHARTVDAAFADVERDHLAALTGQQLAAESRIAAFEAEAEHLPARRAAEAEAEALALLADGRTALARAEALRDGLVARALAGEGGRYYIAIEAARRFELGDVHLPNPPPGFLGELGSLSAWRRFFLGERP